MTTSKDIITFIGEKRRNFITYCEDNITTTDKLKAWLEQLKGLDPPKMFAFIDSYLIPRKRDLNVYVEELSKELNIAADRVVKEKIERYFKCFIVTRESCK